MEMYKTAIINNQPFLFKQIKYKLNYKNHISDCYFLTLRLYEPYDLDKEQEIVKYEDQKYYWDWDSEKTPNTEEEYENEGIPYRIVSGRTNTSVIIDEEEISTKKVVMMPPTKEQFQKQEKRIFEYEYVIRMSIFPYTRTTIKQTVTYFPKEVEY